MASDLKNNQDQEEIFKKNKQGKEYVSNPLLLKEIIKSKEQDQLTDNALKMLMLMCENLQRKLYYSDPDDKKDCSQTAMLDVLSYWRNFDPEKSNNPFAFYTSILTNGLAKGWDRLGKKKFPDSIMTSLDNNIHSL